MTRVEELLKRCGGDATKVYTAARVHYWEVGKKMVDTTNWEEVDWLEVLSERDRQTKVIKDAIEVGKKKWLEKNAKAAQLSFDGEWKVVSCTAYRRRDENLDACLKAIEALVGFEEGSWMALKNRVVEGVGEGGIMDQGKLYVQWFHSWG